MRSNGAKLILRWGLGLIPLVCFIVLIASLDDAVLSCFWQITLLTTILFYIACKLMPKTIRKLQSMPYTYNIENNWGVSGLEAQLMTYVSYHTCWYNHITHTALPLEAFLWNLVVYSYLLSNCNPLTAVIALILISLILTWQAASFKERWFQWFLYLWWGSIALLCVIIVMLVTPELSYRWGVILLLSLGFWRFTGHCIEPVPPALIDNINFVPIKLAGLNKKLLAPALLGFTSEFAAGLPFRLINVWLYVGLQQRFSRLTLNFCWQHAKDIRLLLHQEGWNAHPRTKLLIEDEPY